MKQISNYVGYLIMQVCRSHRDCADTGLKAAGDLYVGQEVVLMHLWQEEGLTQTQLAEKMSVEPPTMSVMLKRMESRGLLIRRQDEFDARVTRVYLTEHGRELEEPVLKVWRELEERTVAGLSETEQALLRRLLMQVVNNLAKNN